MILLIRTKATPDQIKDMLEAFDEYIKLAVDVEREILAGGGYRHSDGEKVLLQDGSLPQDAWGADWYPAQKEVRFEALINIRPHQNNPSMLVLDAGLRGRIEKIVRDLLEDP